MQEKAQMDKTNANDGHNKAMKATAQAAVDALNERDPAAIEKARGQAALKAGELALVEVAEGTPVLSRKHRVVIATGKVTLDPNDAPSIPAKLFTTAAEKPEARLLPVWFPVHAVTDDLAAEVAAITGGTKAAKDSALAKPVKAPKAPKAPKVVRVPDGRNPWADADCGDKAGATLIGRFVDQTVTVKMLEDYGRCVHVETGTEYPRLNGVCLELREAFAAKYADEHAGASVPRGVMPWTLTMFPDHFGRKPRARGEAKAPKALDVDAVIAKLTTACEDAMRRLLADKANPVGALWLASGVLGKFVGDLNTAALDLQHAPVAAAEKPAEVPAPVAPAPAPEPAADPTPTDDDLRKAALAKKAAKERERRAAKKSA